MNLKMLITSDWHLDAVTAGMRRIQDLENAVEATVQHAIKTDVDQYWFLGDLMNPDVGSRGFACISVAIAAALKLADKGIESHWLAGNHDVIDDGSGTTVLSPMRPVSAYVENDLIHVHEAPSFGNLLNRKGVASAYYVALPFTTAGNTYSPVDIVKQAFEEMSHRKLPLIVAGHMTSIPGIIPGSEKDMPRGRDVEYPVEFVKSLPITVIMMNGHFHDQQTFSGIHIPGSLERLTFGEEVNRPGWLMLEC